MHNRRLSLILCSDSVANILFVARFDKKKFLFLCYFPFEVSNLIVYRLVSCENVWYLFSLLISFFQSVLNDDKSKTCEFIWEILVIVTSVNAYVSILSFCFRLAHCYWCMFEMIYVKYKNIFFRITYQLTLWGVFCACWTHRFWKVYPNPMQPWSGVQSCYFFAH